MARASLTFKFCLLVVYLVAYLIFYSWPNFYPIFTPRFLPLLGIDRAVPFVPWTFAVYLSDYVLIAVVILLLPELDRFLRFARMVFGVLILSGFVFLFFPTIYPRPEYPADPGMLIKFFMNIVCSLDQATNCFPSHHVAATSVAAWNMRHKGPRVTALFFFWALLIFASTLTTKQHYFVDILGGVIVASVVIYLEPKLFSLWQNRHSKPAASL